MGFDNQHNPKDSYIINDNFLRLVTSHICDNEFPCFAINDIDINNSNHIDFYIDKNGLQASNYKTWIKEANHNIIAYRAKGPSFGVAIYDLEFNLLSKKTYFIQGTEFYIDGILSHKGAYYVWGEGRDDKNDSRVYINKLDLDLNLLNTWTYSLGGNNSVVYYMDISNDKHLLLPVYVERDSLHILEIDTTGEVLTKVSTSSEHRSELKAVSQLANGNYVYQSFENTPVGEIFCIEQKSGDILWTHRFPKDTVIWSRPYIINRW